MMTGSKTVFIALLVLLCALSHISPVYSDSMPFPSPDWEAKNEFRKKISDLLAQQDFANLEEIAGKLRKEKTLFPDSGDWKIEYFYEALHLNRGSEQEYLDVFKRWQYEYPDSITPLIALATAYKDLAWGYRGGGFANTLTGQQFQKFQEYLKKSISILQQAEKLNAGDPELYAVWIMTAMGMESPKEYLFYLIKKSSETNPLYYPSYEAMAIANLPRWQGYPGELQKFADWAVQQTKSEIGHEMYAKLALKTMAYSLTVNYNELQFDWPLVKKGFEELREKYPRNFFYLNGFAWFACHAGERAIAQDLFDAIGERWDSDSNYIWGSKEMFQAYRDWIKTGQDFPQRRLWGTQEYYYPNGTLKAVYPYDKGALNGQVKTYYPDGTLNAIVTYRDGKKDGIYETYDEQGNLMGRGVYADDELYKIIKADPRY